MSTIRNLGSVIMKGIRVSTFGGTEVLKLVTDLPIPTHSESEILIKVKAVGVNPVDTYIRQGSYASVTSLPYTPGQDSAGIVEKVGNNVSQYKTGDRVYTVRSISGTYAEYTVANPLYVGYLGDHLSFEEGAGIGVPYYTAYRALVIRLNGKAGETVLVHGASGAVGIASVQLAKSMGLTVVGTAGTSEGLQLVKDNGADFVFNHREQGYMDKIASTVAGGVDIILEMLSNVNLGQDLELINAHGRIVVIGCRGNVEINPRLMMTKECIITGVSLMKSSEAEWKQMKPALESGINSGWLKPHIGQQFMLGEASKAHDVIVDKAGTRGKIILKT